MLVTIGLLTAGVFVLDVAVPPGHVMWLLYAFPLWLSARMASPAASLRYASLCTILLGMGLWFAPRGVEVATVIVNRTLGIGLFWGIAYLLFQRREAEHALRAANGRLEQRVAEQTQDLSATHERLSMQLTEQRQIEAALRESRQRFELAAEEGSNHLGEAHIEPAVDEAHDAVEIVALDPYARREKPPRVRHQ